MGQNAIGWTLLLAILVALSGRASPVVAAENEQYLAGLGLHQETGRNIYLGGIYLEPDKPRPSDLTQLSRPWTMEYRIIARRTSIRSLLGGMLLQSEVATGSSPDSVTTDFADAILSTVITPLYAGDSLAVRLDQNGTTTASLNGHELARVPVAGVANYLLQGWIGETGPSTTFRADLLADAVNAALLATMTGNTYSAEREAQVAAWFEPPAPATETVSADEIDPTPDTKMAAATVGKTLPVPAATELTGISEEIAEPAEIATAAAEITEATTPADNAAQVIQVASLTPTPSLLQTQSSAEPSMGVQEYSRRLSQFHGSVVAMVYKQISYPARAVRRNLQGRVELDVTLKRSGELIAVAVAQSSGHQILDAAAVKAARGAFSPGLSASIDPVAVTEFGGDADTLVVPIPVSFELTR